MLDLFERAETLINRIGRQPWVIHAEAVWPSGDKYGSAFNGIDSLARAFCAFENLRLTNEQLGQLSGLDIGVLEEAHQYLAVSADVVRMQLRLQPITYDTKHEGLLHALVNAFGSAHMVGCVGCTSDRASACNADDVADLAYATLKAFIACKPLHALFEINNNHPRSKGTSGLNSLERSLAPRSLGLFFQQMLSYTEIEADSFAREPVVMALQEMIVETRRREYTEVQTAALAGLAGLWCSKTVGHPTLTSGDIGRRRDSLEQLVHAELRKVASWLNKKQPAESVAEYRGWLLDTLPTISFKLAGW